jgi:hypothetical protein
MTKFLYTILIASALCLAADVLILGSLIARREKPVRVWGRLGSMAYHAGLAAWSAALAVS